MSLFAWAEKRVQKFSIWDIGIFKLCLVSLGMLLGAYLSSFVLDYNVAFLVVFLSTWLWLLIRMFR